MSEYQLQEINQHNVGIFTPRQLRYIAKFSQRDLDKNKFDIASEVGVSDRTVTRWFKNPKFANKVNELSLKYVISRIPEVDQKVLEKAINEGDIQAIKLAYQRAGIIEDKKKDAPTTQNNTQVNINIDNDDLKAMLHNSRHLRKLMEDNGLQD